jgi:hypothetical protein
VRWIVNNGSWVHSNAPEWKESKSVIVKADCTICSLPIFIIVSQQGELSPRGIQYLGPSGFDVTRFYNHTVTPTTHNRMQGNLTHEDAALSPLSKP